MKLFFWLQKDFAQVIEMAFSLEISSGATMVNHGGKKGKQKIKLILY